jgi:hypothetical protein
MNLEAAQKGDELIFLGFMSKAEEIFFVDYTTKTQVVAVNKNSQTIRFRKSDCFLVGPGRGKAVLTKELKPETVQSCYLEVQQKEEAEKLKAIRQKAASELDQHISKIQVNHYRSLSTEDINELNRCFRGIFDRLDHSKSYSKSYSKSSSS